MNKKEIAKILKDRRDLIKSSSDMSDEHDVGMYNGVEYVLCEFEEREPEYLKVQESDK